MECKFSSFYVIKRLILQVCNRPLKLLGFGCIITSFATSILTTDVAKKQKKKEFIKFEKNNICGFSKSERSKMFDN